MTRSALPRLSDDAQDALSAYRDASPGSRRRAANLDAVRRRVSADSPRKAAAAAGVMWPLAWGLVSAAAAAGLVWGLVEARSLERETSSAPTEAPAVAAQPEPTAVPAQHAPTARPQLAVDPVEPLPEQGATKSVVPPKGRRAEPTPPPASGDLREETRRLRSVRSSIAAAAWDDAARELAAYTHAFPNGALREDAQAYRIVVRCEQGRPADEQRRLFDERYPSSPHAARMDAACRKGKKE